MRARPVVLNNTPLVALWIVGQLELLRELYSEVLIPEPVKNEFLAIERNQRQAALDAAPWIKVVSLANPQRMLAYTGLDEGEASVLALAEELDASLVIVDERKGRRYAKRLGLAVTATRGSLLLAKEQGLIATIAPLLLALQGSGLYLDPDLVHQVLALAQENS